MQRKKKEETIVESNVEEATPDNGPIFMMGKRPQTRSLLTNPRSKWYDPKIAKRRAKEKNRRKVNRLRRK